LHPDASTIFNHGSEGKGNVYRRMGDLSQFPKSQCILLGKKKIHISLKKLSKIHNPCHDVGRNDWLCRSRQLPPNVPQLQDAEILDSVWFQHFALAVRHRLNEVFGNRWI
jgi:hypothetical protein